jgi:acyl carrier protein phosphodiesterase
MATSVNQFFVIGSWMSSPIATPTNYFVGYIKEMLVYHANHTPEQIAEVNDYLGSKYP